jgi:branched-chain amino acid transport system permease protein
VTRVVQFLVSTATTGSVLALVAVGYNLIYSTTRVINFAQSSILVVGSYAAFYFSYNRPVSTTNLKVNGLGLPIGVALVAATVISTIVGVLVYYLALRPLGRFDPQTNIGWILTTFSLLILVDFAVRKIFGSESQALPRLVSTIFGREAFQPAGVPIGPDDILVVGTAVAIVVGLEILYARTVLGKAFRAVAQDPTTAGLMGINARGMIILSFAFAGAIAAVGAVLLAPSLGGVRPEAYSLLGIQAFIAATFGGLGSTQGAIAGGFVIAAIAKLPVAFRSDLNRYDGLILFAVFALVLVLRPSGLFGQRSVEKV